MTETVKIVNPYSEVNNLTASENKNHVKPDTFGSIFPTPQWVNAPSPGGSYSSNSPLPEHRKWSNTPGEGGVEIEVSI